MYNLEGFYEFVNNHSLALALFIIAIIELIKHFAQKKVEVSFVEKIAKIQEEVKAEFAKQNETIKAELSFSNQQKLNFMALEREAIFDFNKSYGTFYQLLSDYTFVSPINFVDINLKEMEERISLIKETRNAYIIASNNLTLFYNSDVTFLNKRDKLNIEITAFSSKLLSHLNVIQLDFQFQEFDLNNKAFEYINELHSKMSFASKTDLLNSDFFIKSVDEFKKIKESHLDLINILEVKLKG